MAMPPPPVFENVEAAMLFATTALESKRDEDVVLAMEYVVRMTTVGELTGEQKTMVDLGYRMVMDAKRKARRNWEFIRLMEEEADIPRNLAWSRHYIDNLESEMERLCRDARNIIFSRVLLDQSSSHDQVYYRTMVGDLYRYRSESKGDNWINFACVAANDYQRAEEIAVRDQLPGNNYARLLLACNFSTHCYLILSKPQRALAILDTALDAALINWPVLQLDYYCMKLVNLLGKKRDAWFGPAIVVEGGINADGGEAQGQIHGGNN